MDEIATTDYRRIQTTGRGSYIISLPKKWVCDMRLSKGEQVAVLRNSDGSLSLIPKDSERKGQMREVEILLQHDMEIQSILRRLVSLYLVGYNDIKIILEDPHLLPAQRETIREFVRKKLMGTEIVTESSEEIVLQVLLSYPQLTVENAIKRMTAMADWMHKDAIRSLRDKNKDLAQEVIRMDNEVDRFSFYIVRQLKTAMRDPQIIQNLGLKSPVDCLGYRLVVKSVERAADHAVRIAEHLVKGQINRPLVETIQKMSDFASATFDTAMKSLYTRDYQIADGLLSKARRIESLEAEAISDITKSHLTSGDVPSLRLVLESLRRITEYGSDIAEVVLNLTAVENN